MNLTLAQVAEMLTLPPPGGEASRGFVSGYSIDSRAIGPEDLFFALRGPRHDGHEHVAEVFEKGAVAAVVSDDWVERNPGLSERLGPILAVPDPAEALRRLASLARQRWGLPIVAVSGSNGKTTTKDLIHELLSTGFRVSKTTGNLNNDLGLPLSILRIEDEARMAVLEMGMNHAGEIRALARIARPNVAVITNVSAAHAGNFVSVDEIARAKRELIEELPADGTAVLNADDEKVREFGDAHQGPVVTFGFGEEADWRATGVETLGVRGSRFHLQRRPSTAVIDFETRLVGRHNVLNLVAAMAVGGLFGIEPYDLQEAVSKAEAATMRGVVREIEGVTIIDDSYNANPRAMEAMLDVLRHTPARRRIAVLGSMLELGDGSQEHHEKIGAAAARSELALLLTVGEPTKPMMTNALREGMPARNVIYCADAEAAGETLAAQASAGDVILFKGSRGVGLEKAIAVLEKALTGGGVAC